MLMTIKPLAAAALALFTFTGISLGRTGAPLSTSTPHTASVSPPQKTKVREDKMLPGYVIVKLNKEGAYQLAAHNDFTRLVAQQHAQFNFQHARQRFPGHSIMRYRNHTSTQTAVDDDISRILDVQFANGASPKDAAATLMTNPFVEYAEPLYERHEFYTPTNSYWPQQWDMDTIHCPAAWDITMGDTSVVIAIVDDGVDTSHPDIKPNIWHNDGEMGLDANGRDKRSNGIDDEKDGYIDDWQGWDFAGASAGSPQDNDPSGGDHGIHVAGIAAGAGIPTGTIGVAPHCRLMLIKTAYTDDPETIVFGDQGIMYAADHGAKVINCSWGGSSYLQSEQDLINTATAMGSLVVAAAGNNSDGSPIYPGWYPHVLDVTGSTTGNQPDPFYADYGPRVDVIAPGTGIWSTYVNNGYTELTGTSMATPHAAGVCALVASRFPNLTPDQIAARVRITSNSIDSSLYFTFQKSFGYGLIDAYRAVHDTNVKAVIIDSFYVTNDNNNDGVLEPGETGSLRVRFKNLLAPTESLTATIVPMDTLAGSSIINPYVTITNARSYIGALPTLDTATTVSNDFRVTVAQDIPANFQLSFRVYFNDGAYSDYRYFTMILNPTYITMNRNDIGCTFNSRGNSAFNDFPTNTEGIGFTYKGGDNILYEGSLMIATDSIHVVNVARDNSSGGQDSDFVYTQRTVLISDSNGTQEMTAQCTDDDAAPANKLGVQVNLHNYEYVTPGNTNYVIVTYDVKNTSGAALNNLYCGMYMDWDIGPNGDSNYAAYDDPYKIGWVWRNNDTSYPVVGSALLSPQNVNFYALENDEDSCSGPYVNSGFTRQEKYMTLSSGIGKRTTCLGDVSDVMAGGPVTLQPGQDTIFAFALIAGPDLQSLESGATAAQATWNSGSKASPQTEVFFPSVNIYGTTDTTIDNLLKNTGNTAETLTLSISGANAPSFSLRTPSSVQLNAGATQNVQINFEPSTIGSQTALLIIANSAAPSDTVLLFGQGLPYGVSLTPLNMSFNDIAPGEAESQSVAITSSRNDTVVAAFSITGPDSAEFSLPEGNPLSITPGSLSFPVDFNPVLNGPDSAYATLNVKITGGPSYTIQLFGTTQPTGINIQNNILPQTAATAGNYPNPFTGKTVIFYSGTSSVRSLLVTDILGRIVADLTPQLSHTTYGQQAVFDASELPNGTYFYKVSAASQTFTGQMTVLK